MGVRLESRPLSLREERLECETPELGVEGWGLDSGSEGGELGFRFLGQRNRGEVRITSFEGEGLESGSLGLGEEGWRSRLPGLGKGAKAWTLVFKAAWGLSLVLRGRAGNSPGFWPSALLASRGRVCY